MTVDVFEKETGKKVMSQTVIRSFTHYAEEKEFMSSEDFVLPQDTVGFIYDIEGSRGVNGAEHTETANFLEVRSVPCAWDYQPNSAGTTCVACPAPTWKQYKDGDCLLYTCPTGQKANAAGNGCEQIVCPSGQHLEGNDCVADVVTRSCNNVTLLYGVDGRITSPEPTKEACETKNGGKPCAMVYGYCCRKIIFTEKCGTNRWWTID